ncbi:MAG: hypothetical protein DMD83_07790, partial [Candidatus Rokuibacteriota bacterium]
MGDYVVWQPAIQLAGIAAGLLFVNLMSTREYALYALASAAMTLLGLLCDLGITNSLLYFRREASIRGVSFDAYLRGAMWLRRLLLAVAAPLFLGVFAGLALSNGLGAVATCAGALIIIAGAWFQITAAIHLVTLRLAGRYGASYRAELVGAAARLAGALIIIAGAWFQITAAIHLVTLRLAGRYGASYRAELVGAAARLAGAAVMAVTSMVYAVPALVAGALGSLLTARAAASRTGPGDARHVVVDPRPARREIVRYLVPTLPSAIYFSFQSPLLAFLSAMFGDARNIAEVGALGRLGLIVGLLTGLIPGVIIPRLAGVLDERLYGRRYAQYLMLLGVSGLTLVVSAYGWPGLFLALLGPRYRG